MKYPQFLLHTDFFFVRKQFILIGETGDFIDRNRNGKIVKGNSL